jgi:hypothetical protein
MIVREVIALLPNAGTVASMLALCAIAGLLGIAVTAIIRRASKSPHERERIRRWTVNARGRMGDAIITDVRDNLVIYEYSVRGVMYNASQDVSALCDFLPEDRSLLAGPASLKYHPKNPANSIVICERWSGLRVPLKQPLGQPAGAVPVR